MSAALRDAIFGYTGYVGQTLLRHLSNPLLYNSKNAADICGKEFARLFICAMPAQKWLINKNPEQDLDTLNNIKAHLSTVRAREVYLISTVDVFDCAVAQDEFGSAYADHPYGRHRRDLEIWIHNTFPGAYIIRLPGLFGTGLKKNVIYDIIHDNCVSAINPMASYQWYNMERLYDDIIKCKTDGIKCVQFVSEPITTADILAAVDVDESKCQGSGQPVVYRLKTLHSKSGYWTSRADILQDICTFIHAERIRLATPYTLMVSNMICPSDNLDAFYAICQHNGIRSVEIVPTKYSSSGSWSDISVCLPPGCKVGSMQSILYNTGIEIFKAPDAFIEHYKRVLDLCVQLGCGVIVFGSPKQRHIGLSSLEERICLFRQLGVLSAEAGVVLCVEANARAYGATWLTTLGETVQFCCEVDHPNIRINLDTGNYIMEADTYPIHTLPIDMIGHVQISYPNLDSTCSELDEEFIKSVIAMLRANKYSAGISLEVREQQQIASITNTIYTYANIYGIC